MVYSLIILLFLCGAPEWPLHSLSHHLSLSVLLWPTCSSSFSGSMSRHSLEKNLHWMHLVIFQWLYSSECWILWKEISQGWYIVGNAATLKQWPRAKPQQNVACLFHVSLGCLSVTQFLHWNSKRLSSVFIKRLLMFEKTHCIIDGNSLKALKTFKNGYKGCCMLIRSEASDTKTCICILKESWIFI